MYVLTVCAADACIILHRILASHLCHIACRLVQLVSIDIVLLLSTVVLNSNRLQLHPGRLRLLKFAVLTLLAMHWNACIIAMIGNMAIKASLNSWIDVEDRTDLCNTGVSFMTEMSFWTNSDDDGSGPLPETIDERCIHRMKWTHQWLSGLYWAIVTMTTTGYGDVTPANTWEMAFVILAMIEAGFAFSFFIGNIAMLLRRADLRKMKYQESLETWENFIHKEHVPQILATRIRSYVEYMYTHPVPELPAFARESLPKTLLQDISGHLYTGILRNLPIFSSLSNAVLTVCLRTL